MANSLVEITLDKFANIEIFMPLVYLKFQKLCQYGRLCKSHFTNNFTDKMATIFISHKKWADCDLILQLRHEKIITIPRDLFEQLDLTEIEFVSANNIL